MQPRTRFLSFAVFGLPARHHSFFNCPHFVSSCCFSEIKYFFYSVTVVFKCSEYFKCGPSVTIAFSLSSIVGWGRIWEGGGGGGVLERQRYSTYTGSETDTYIWSQQGSPEICFCTGGNRVCSQALCDLKTCPDQKGCPGPCLGETVRWTQSGGWGPEWGVGGGVTWQSSRATLLALAHSRYDTRGYDLGKIGINKNSVSV